MQKKNQKLFILGGLVVVAVTGAAIYFSNGDLFKGYLKTTADHASAPAIGDISLNPGTLTPTAPVDNSNVALNQAANSANQTTAPLVTTTPTPTISCSGNITNATTRQVSWTPAISGYDVSKINLVWRGDIPQSSSISSLGFSQTYPSTTTNPSVTVYVVDAAMTQKIFDNSINFGTYPSATCSVNFSGSAPLQPIITQPVYQYNPPSTPAPAVPPLAVYCMDSAASASVGQSVTFTAHVTGGSGLYAYSWGNTDGTQTYTTINTAVKTYTAADAATFSPPPSAYVVVYDATLPQISAPTAEALCDPVTVSGPLKINQPALKATCVPSNTNPMVGAQITFTGNVTGGSSPYTYSWSGSGGLTGQTSSTATATYNSVATPSASYTVTDSLGKTANAVCPAINVVQQPLPLTAFCTPSDASPIVGENVAFIGNVSGGSAPYTYQWAGSGMGGQTGQIANTSFVNAGNQQVNFIVKDANSTIVNASCPVTVSTPTTTTSTGSTGSTGTVTYVPYYVPSTPQPQYYYPPTTPAQSTTTTTTTTSSQSATAARIAQCGGYTDGATFSDSTCQIAAQMKQSNLFTSSDFRAADLVKRYEAALLVVRILKLPENACSVDKLLASYHDVDTKAAYLNQLCIANNLGIINGYKSTTNSFSLLPARDVTLREFARMLLNGYAMTVKGKMPSNYNEVALTLGFKVATYNDWFGYAFQFLVNQNILNLTQLKSIHLDDPMTRYNVAEILSNIINSGN